MRRWTSCKIHINLLWEESRIAIITRYAFIVENNQERVVPIVAGTMGRSLLG